MQLRKVAVLMLFICSFGSFSAFGSDNRALVSAGALRIIRRFEGFRASVYEDCAGYPTIGYGHLITSSDGDLASRVLSESEAQALLIADIHEKANISRYMTVGLSSNQSDALTSLCFNIGTKAFSGSDVVKSVKAGKIREAYEYFGHRRRAGGQIIQGLVKRRFAELFIFADETLDPGDNRAPSVQWGTDPMKITDENWAMLRADFRAEAVQIYESYTDD